MLKGNKYCCQPRTRQRERKYGKIYKIYKFIKNYTSLDLSETARLTE